MFEAVETLDRVELETIVRSLVDELDMKPGQLFGAIRLAVTGKPVSPPLFETIHALGRNRSLEGLHSAVIALSAIM